MSGFTIAADHLLAFATEVEKTRDEVGALAPQIEPQVTLSWLAWPMTDGGMREAYESATQAYVELVNGLKDALTITADRLRWTATEFKKRETENVTAFTGN